LRVSKDQTVSKPSAKFDPDSGQPLYVQLAHALSERIESGAYPVGELLPTEAELGVTYNVSRYTVRQAIQHLRQQGLVSARKGVGTRVEARGQTTRYLHAIPSLTELLQFAHETRLDLIDHETLKARGPLVEQLGCRPGKAWVRVAGIRYGADDDLPICHSEVLFDAAYSSIAEDVSSLRTALWSLIEQRFGETVIEVDQRIEATLLDAEMAPALKFTRRYYVTGRRLVELSIHLHPADRFSYWMTINRDAAQT